MSAAPSFELLTSLRYDPRLRGAPWNRWRGDPPSPFCLLPSHLERLVNGAREFGWVRALEALGVEAGVGVDNVEGDVYVYAEALERFRALCQGCVDAYFVEHPELSGGGGGDSGQALKIRITLSKDGVLHTTASPTPPRPYDLLAASTFDPTALDAASLPPFASPPVRVLLDTQPTHTSLAGVGLAPHKTTARGAYDAARARAGIPPLASAPPAPIRPSEVLLHTPGGAHAHIMDASIRTPFFYRAGRWVTPALPRPCAPPSHDTATTTPRAGTRALAPTPAPAPAPAPALVPLAGTVRRFLLAHGRAVEGDVPLGEVKVGEWVLLCNAVEGCVLGVVENGAARMKAKRS